MQISVRGEVFEWRGPAPFYFLAVPAEASQVLRGVAEQVSYGWGMLPVAVTIGEVQWRTSLWPKDGRYLLPLKDAVRRQAQIAVGDVITAEISAGSDRLDRADLVALVTRIRSGEAGSEAEEEAWLGEFAAAVPHPRAIDLVLYPDIEVGPDANAEAIVDTALTYR